MTKPDMALLTWIKSSRSGADGGCIEIAHSPEMVLVRDSMDPTGPVLTFSRTSWQVFVRGIPSMSDPR